MIVRMTAGGVMSAWKLELTMIAMLGATNVFPEDHRVLCLTNLDDDAANILRAEAGALGWECRSMTAGEFPRVLMGPSRRGGWWKFAPPRLAPDEDELWIDNDIVLWNMPPAIRDWKNSGSVLMAGTTYYTAMPQSIHKMYPRRHDYGSFNAEVKHLLGNDTSLNSGFIGFPAGYDPLIYAEEIRHGKQYGVSDQGYMAYVWAREYVEDKWPRLVDFKSVPFTNSKGEMPLTLDYDGIHLACEAPSMLPLLLEKV